LIAISYAGITVLFPLINYSIEVEKNEIMTFIQRFFFIAAITIPFDIRDLNFDDKNLKTLPQVIGIQKSKVVGLFFLMLFLGLEFLKNSTEVSYRINFIISLISLFFLLKATHDQNKYYSAFFVESIPIMWLLLLVFMQ
jgi:4-hydroxybenzoate polyprenyltransferase